MQHVQLQTVRADFQRFGAACGSEAKQFVAVCRGLLNTMAPRVSFHWARSCVVALLLLSLSLQTLPAAAEARRRNYYEILHVEPTASASEIKKSFRKLALKFHPDKSKGADAERRFREAAEGIKKNKAPSLQCC